MNWGNYRLDFDHLTFTQAFLLWVALAIPTVWLAVRSMRALDPIRKWAAVGLRLDVLLFIILILAGLRLGRSVEDVSVLVLRDTSGSVANVQTVRSTGGARGVQAAIDTFVSSQVKRKPAQDRIGAISFDWLPRVDAAADTAWNGWNLGSTSTSLQRSGTNVSAAIQLGLAAVPGDTRGRLLLFWDGNQTAGNLDEAVSAAASLGVPIDVVPLNYRIVQEVSVERLVAPPAKQEGEAFTLDVVMRSQSPTPATVDLRVLDNDTPIDLDPATPGVQSSRRVTLKQGTNVEHVRLPAMAGGAHRFKAIIDSPQAVDTMTSNNSSEAVTLVRGKGRVLYIAGAEEGSHLADALRAAGMDVVEHVGNFDAVPRDLLSFEPYQAIVLSNVSRGAAGLDESQQQALTRYVRDMGGGLVVTGGPQALGAGGWIGTELENILPVELNPPSVRAMPLGALVLVIDRSGSMGAPIAGSNVSKQEAVNAAAVEALKALQRRDHVGVVIFDGLPEWVVPLGVNADPVASAEKIHTATPRGGTNIAPALDTAITALDALPANDVTVKHILLLTDGRSMDADYPWLLRRIQEGKITLSTIGVGDDADYPLLTSLAQLGGGRDYRVDDARMLPRILIKEAFTLRRALIREEPITPMTTEPDEMLAGMSEFPELSGLVRTWPRTNVLVRVPLVSGGKEASPLLAYNESGLGRVAVFTSDATGRWASSWVASPLYNKFWPQVVRRVARSSQSREATARVESLGDGRAKLIVESIAADGSFQGFLKAGATIVSPDATDPPRALRLDQTSPGRYEATFDANRAGAYLASIQLQGGREGNQWLPAAFVADPSAELRAVTSNQAAVEAIAARTRGRVIDVADPMVNLFSREGLENRYASLPATSLLLVATFVALLLDVAVRRIAWDRNSLAWLASAITGNVLRRGPQQASGSTSGALGALREIRTKRASGRANQDVLKSAPPRTGESQQNLIDSLLTNQPTKTSQPTTKPADDKPKDLMSSLAEAKREAERKMRGE